MRILHAYCLNYNLGDHALGIGMKNLLRAYLDVDLIGSVNLQGRIYDEYYINEVVNKRYDLLVIGGGGIIHGAHWPNGWFWLIKKALIKQIRIPFIVYGAGYNYFKGEEGIPKRGAEHLKETMRRASFFSVRNDGSASRLREATGLRASVVPDPGFHAGLNSEYGRKEKNPYVLVQLANDKPEYRFGGEEGRKRFIKGMKLVIGGLKKKYKVILAPHVFDDVALCRSVAAGLANTEVWPFERFAFDHTEECLGYYKHAEFVLAMRGHGQILPICFNTPVISMENHPKHRGLMDNLGLLEYNVLIGRPGFVNHLNAAVNKIELNLKKLRETYLNINTGLRLDSKRAFSDIKKKLKK